MMKIVIAGNYQQYKEYLKETKQSPKDVRYISSSEQLRGLRNVKVIRYGTWWKSPVITAVTYYEVISRP